jgi:hypothetical protein
MFTGCAVSAPPIENTPRVAIDPVKDQVTVSASPTTIVGTVVPVDISIANGTTEPRLLVPSQIFAINEHDQKIISIPPGEAIRAAGNANALKAGLTGAAKNAAIGAGWRTFEYLRLMRSSRFPGHLVRTPSSSD